MIIKKIFSYVRSTCDKCTMTAHSMGSDELNMRKLIQKIFLDSVAAVNPVYLTREALQVNGKQLRVCNKTFDLNENVHLVGFGKAVLGMACESERILMNHLKSGVICVPKGIQATFQHKPDFNLQGGTVIKVFEGAENNLPDEDAEKGANAIIDLIYTLKDNDLLLVLISGGGSSLLPIPKPNITLQDKAHVLKLLSSAGADIAEVNSVRKKLSALKGGGLAEWSYPHNTVCLILSDVINDPLDVIASGPTVPNFDQGNAGYQVIQKYKLDFKIPKHILNIIKDDWTGPVAPIAVKNYCHVDNFIVGTNSIAVDAAKKSAESSGLNTLVLSTEIQGLVAVVAQFYARLGLAICKVLQMGNIIDFYSELHVLSRLCNIYIPQKFKTTVLPKLAHLDSPICIVAGGETTVKLNGNGKGGRNQELALHFSEAIHRLKKSNVKIFEECDVVFLSAGTDGIDGPTDVAGAVGSPRVIDIAQAKNLNADKFLASSDSYNFFKSIDGGSFLINTGHTGTNVMDIHILIAYKK